MSLAFSVVTKTSGLQRCTITKHISKTSHRRNKETKHTSTKLCVIITVSCELTLLDGLLLVKRVPARVGSVSGAWEKRTVIAIANVLVFDVIIKGPYNLKVYRCQ